MLREGPNGAFSQEGNGTLQLAWDSMSLKALRTCPRKYYWSMIVQRTPKGTSDHLTFGLAFHAALETYDWARAGGKNHEAATLDATAKALRDTWGWRTDHKYKNRFNLIRSVVWYLDAFAHDPLETVILANGKPAVELSFRLESGYLSSGGEPFLLSGHLDRVATMGGGTFIVDRKTTKSTIGSNFFASFTPDTQFSLYALAGRLGFGLPISGLIVDGCQVAIGFSRFERGLVGRSEEALDEWHSDLGGTLEAAEKYARDGHWPMNDTACGMYGGCPYRGICAKSATVRDEWLRVDFIPWIWNPLDVRGNI